MPAMLRSMRSPTRSSIRRFLVWKTTWPKCMSILVRTVSTSNAASAPSAGTSSKPFGVLMARVNSRRRLSAGGWDTTTARPGTSTNRSPSVCHSSWPSGPISTRTPSAVVITARAPERVIRRPPTGKGPALAGRLVPSGSTRLTSPVTNASWAYGTRCSNPGASAGLRLHPAPSAHDQAAARARTQKALGVWRRPGRAPVITASSAARC